MVQVSLKAARGDARELQPLETPRSYYCGWPLAPTVGNVARVYSRMAADLRNCTRSAPTFDDAVTLHELIAAVEILTQCHSL